jgi:protein-S-isoprenylcysteine O-methyltransferase Ste14
LDYRFSVEDAIHGLILFWTMRHAGTPIDPREPVSKLVVEEPFRYTRNPA